MASRIYTTDALVLSRTGVGESSLLVSLFSREFGRIDARAQGARLSGSKLRFGLEPLSVGKFALVKGRGGWKLVGVEALSRMSGNREAVKMFGKIAVLLQRLTPPHEAVSSLYDIVKADLSFIEGAVDTEMRKSAECITVLHILSALGYLPNAKEIEPFTGRETTPELAYLMKPMRSRAVALINTSLSASGL